MSGLKLTDAEIRSVTDAEIRARLHQIARDARPPHERFKTLRSLEEWLTRTDSNPSPDSTNEPKA